MDKKSTANSNTHLVEKLKKTTKRIQKARKNLNLVEKAAAEFQEIQKLLKDDVSVDANDLKKSEAVKSEDRSCLPINSPGVKVFHDDLLFYLFGENDCNLKTFLQNEETCLIFGKTESIPTEVCFRHLVESQITEILIPKDRNSSPVCLYVLYLLSVHHDVEFVRACFDFLKHQVFYIYPEDFFPIFINFGCKTEELFDFCEEPFLKRFQKKNGVKEEFQKTIFPFFNLEMVGQILLHCITKDYLIINTAIKPLITALAKVTLDPKINSGSALRIYSIVFSALCEKVQKDYRLEEIVDWIHLKEEHLFNQVEICRVLSKSIAPAVQESLVLKTICQILDLKNSPIHPPIKVSHLRSFLSKIRTKELPPLELFCLLQLMNGSLPGLTANLKDSNDIKTSLTSLEKKISKTEDSVDLIRLKLEAAKLRNLVTSTNNQFAIVKF